MISVIITTYKEKETLPKAIEAILDQMQTNADLTQIDADFEILVVAPDEETEKIVKEFSEKHPEVKFLKDEGRGKPAALNLALRQAQGDILILTDGDVFLIKCAIAQILRNFKNEKIGAVSGHPVSLNKRNNLFGYWSHFLTDAADYVRRKKTRRGDYLVCSGYLYAIRNIIKEIPENTLVEDSIISQIIWQQGYKIVYEPEAKVYVKYPDNFSDWLRQKIRSTGGYVQKFKRYPPSSASWRTSADALISNQIKDLKKLGKMRGFFEEVKDGIKLFFTYPKNLKELFWTKLLYLARLYLWLLILWRIKILKKTAWPRVESTKIL